MKNKKIWTVLGAALLICLVFALGIGLRAAPAVNHGLRIGELLQPMGNAENQRMHLSISAKVEGESLALESDIFLVKEEGISYLVLEQKGSSVYIADQVLFLENGKAFKIADQQTGTISYRELLPYIGTLYEALKITAEDRADGKIYSVSVTGNQVAELLSAFGETIPTQAIDKLQLQLTEQNGKLKCITFSGGGKLDGASVILQVTLSEFRILAAGDYPIPAAVKERAASVDPETLLSLSEDLYRLVLALAPLGDMASLEGTLALAVDCGVLQLDTQVQLSDLQTDAGGQLDPELLRELPEVVGVLCTQGDIRCTRNGNGYVYTLELDQQGMQELARRILPELAQYSGNLTKGSVTITLAHNAVTSMAVFIQGKISAWIAQIPLSVRAEYILE